MFFSIARKQEEIEYEHGLSEENVVLIPFNILYKFNPRLTSEILFRLKLGYPLDLDNPQTYNEKLQWIKRYAHNPHMPKCCDKYLVREYIESKGCGNLLNKLLWQGFDPAQIPFDELPERFVAHGSAFNIICTDKNMLDREGVITKCRRWLKAKFLPCYGEWFYGAEPPRVVAEEYLEGDDGLPLFDYKIFCFNGKPQMVYADTWKDGEHTINVYDIDLNLFEGVELRYPNNDTLPQLQSQNVGMKW